MHQGDLVVPEVRTGQKPFTSLLFVDGNLTVKSLFRDCLEIAEDLRAPALAHQAPSPQVAGHDDGRLRVQATWPVSRRA
ncbi:MAG: hypothetical protein JNJ54_31155 [Myxococcaceae bacterium]|nr:hypothetical protein [Myxococcaceae bacterium]